MRRNVKSMPRKQQQCVMSTLKAQPGNPQRRFHVNKPIRTPLRKPTSYKPKMKEGAITPMTERGDIFITNWNNTKIDKIEIESD